MSEMCKTMSAMKKASEDMVGSVFDHAGMEEGRKPKEDVGEIFKKRYTYLITQWSHVRNALS